MFWPKFIFFLVGLAVGSFLNVVIYRLPRGRSIISPGSFCPKCETPIKFYNNIPVLSYLFLKGRCKNCNSNISLRYPIIELLTGILFYFLFDQKGLGLEFVVSVFFVSLLITISFIDLDFQIIPDVLSIGGLFVGLFLSFFRNPHFYFKDSIYGALVGGGILFIIAYGYELLTKREGMGFGDVKLLAMIGSFTGVRGALFSLISGSLFGTILGLFLIYVKGKDLRYAIPFGPFLSMGALCFIFFGDNFIWWISKTIFSR
ncbi:MAG: prepilin peptidase [Deltaproteobacteria bacterium]|nr:prepilin peptidase [Deltaproteobacteria bacterium]